nr:EOG090X0508 [Lepidurus arcticus]
MGKHKKAKKAKNVTATRQQDEPDEVKNAPHSIVIYRGTVGHYLEELMKDFRKVMEPNTASSLKIQERTTLKDYAAVAGMLHVTHFCVFSRSEISPYLRLARFPHGPTLTFRVMQYCLSRDVISAQKRQNTYDLQFKTRPLVVLNNFSGEGMQMKLMASMFQNMFPSINVAKVKLSTIRRCVLFTYDSANQTVEFRHYSIKVKPVGISKAVKKLVQTKVPDLSRFNDITEFMENAGQMSESEGEDDPASNVVLPQKLASRGNQAGLQSSIKMIELGPRMTLQLIKIEEDLLDGEVLYHQFIQKTEAQKKLIRLRREQRKREIDRARKIQEAHLKKKQEEKESQHAKAAEISKRRYNLIKESKEGNEEQDEDDDEAWYAKEVGQKPDEGLFEKRVPAAKRKPTDNKKSGVGAATPFKKARFEDRDNNTKTNRKDFGGKGKFNKRENDGAKDAGRKGKFNKRGENSGGKDFGDFSFSQALDLAPLTTIWSSEEQGELHLTRHLGSRIQIIPPGQFLITRKTLHNNLKKNVNMGNWQLEVAKMGLYIMFPVVLFYHFNQAEYFEDWMIKMRRELYPPENKMHRKEIEETIRQMNARKGAELQRLLEEEEKKERKLM